MTLFTIYITGVLLALILGKLFNMYAHKSSIPVIPLLYILGSWTVVVSIILVKVIDIILFISKLMSTYKVNEWFTSGLKDKS